MEDRLQYRVPEVAVILNISDQRSTSCLVRAILNPSRLIAVVWCGARIYTPMLMGSALSTSLPDLVITS
jgi:hypothetical protein